jgi:hypothetical protein
LRVRKPKNFLGKGSKNRFRGAGAGKVGGVKNATEEENEAVLSKKKKPPLRRLTLAAGRWKKEKRRGR